MYRNQKGFTLIEIIAVLVILGILAAVAVPKYMRVQSDARNKATAAAVAEGISRVNNAAAQYILSNGITPNASSVIALISTDAGDFKLTYGNGTTVVSITGSATSGAALGGSTTGSAKLPTT